MKLRSLAVAMSVLTDQLFEKARRDPAAGLTPYHVHASAAPMAPEQERAHWEGEQQAIEQVAIDNAFADEIREEKAQRRAGYKSLLAFAQQLAPLPGIPRVD